VRYDRAAYRSRFEPSGVATRPSAGTAAAGTDTPDALLQAWLAMWRRYDLDGVDELFVDDPQLTYFASDREGLLEGLDTVREYHADAGFVPGGFQPESELWLEEVTVSDFGESAVIGAVWYFGNRLDRQAAGRGPLTMALTRTPSGFKISHVNFGNYAPER
jgi:hypothetical protein